MEEALVTEDLLALRAVQLEKREEDLQKMHDLLWKSRKQSAKEFKKKYHSTIKDFDFKPGQIVVVRNSALEMDLGAKWKPRYIGPYVVVRRHEGGSYTLAEMDGTISKLKFAAKQLFPFHARSSVLPDSDVHVDSANIDENHEA